MSDGITIIAEAGVNHNGDPGLALKLIDVAAEAGADAVKFQTFIPEKVAAESAPKAEYQAERTGSGESQLDMLRKLALSDEIWPRLKTRCAERGIEFMSTPFDPESAALLRDLGVKRFKIGSGELTNLPFLRTVATYGQAMVLSTGMADAAEVAAAVETVRGAGCTDLTLLHCVSNYPAAAADANLNAMAVMTEEFGVPVGWSDHTDGIHIAIAAAALGATMIEKHFTLDRSMAGPDHAASLEPAELAQMIRAIRDLEAAMGDGVKKPAASEAEMRKIARRSLVAARDIDKGARITEAMLDARRPGDGISPMLVAQILGKTAKTDIAEGTMFSFEIVE